jgi:hypothetical protein
VCAFARVVSRHLAALSLITHILQCFVESRRLHDLLMGDRLLSDSIDPRLECATVYLRLDALTEASMLRDRCEHRLGVDGT